MAQRIHPADVMKALANVRDLASGRDLVSLGRVKGVEVGDNRVSFILEVPNPSSPAAEQMVQAARQAVESLGGGKVEIQVAQAAVGSSPGSAAGAQQPSLTPGVKATIAVASGKGGVGKSTMAANLAVALRRLGFKVGLMDTDVYGPSVPTLLGGQSEPKVVEGKLEPPVEHGVKFISMGFFLPKNEAVIWRGPMLHKTVQQFLGDVRWGELDYLVIDLPPGTGDIQLSLCQTASLTGAVIVSTPQDLALSVASKAIFMFEKLKVPVLGVIENMSYYSCPQCGHREDIFGHGGARAAAEKFGFPFLGEIPLDPQIRSQSDTGQPAALDETTANGRAFREVALALDAQVDRFRIAEPITIE